MIQSRFTNPCRRRPSSTYHVFGHSGAAALDVQTRCEELHLDYVPFLIEDEASVDHQRFESYRRNLEENMARHSVAGIIFEPPCETFIGDRFRDVSGPGRYGRVRRRKAVKTCSFDDEDKALVRIETILMERSAAMALTAAKHKVPYIYITTRVCQGAMRTSS